MIDNTILARYRRGQTALSLTLIVPSALVVELAAQAGFDAINIDGEHGAFSLEGVDETCRVANGLGLCVTARVPSIEPHVVNSYLDRGVQGIVGPHVESGEEAQRLVDACRYPPDGRRSWGWGRGTGYNDDARINAAHDGRFGFMAWANRNVLTFAQIESKKGYDNLDAILAVEGLTGIAGGPFDFAASLGYPAQPNHPEQVRLSADAEARARRAGKVVMSDMTGGVTFHDLFLNAARAFVAERRG